MVWGAAVGAVVLLAFAPAAVGLRTLARRDTDRLYAPIRTLVVEALREGRLPLWNPHECAGKPLFAEGIHSVLHPVSLLGAALAPGSMDALLLGYLVAAALGGFALASALGCSRAAAAGGGLAFALSGYSVSMTGNPVFLAGLASMPWVLASARVAGAGAPWGVVLTALSTCIAFLSGDTQCALVAGALGAALAADAGGWRGLGRALLGMFAGTLAAGVQLAATWKLLQHTYRGVELLPREKLQWPLAPARLFEWIVPGLARGRLDVLPPQPPGASEALPGVFAESVYVGLPLLVAASVGFLSGRRRTGVVLLAACTVLLWLALGHHLGARQLLDFVPVWNRFRYAEKLVAPLTLVLCAAAALGLDALGSGVGLPRAALRATVAVALAACATLAVALLAPAAIEAVLPGDALERAFVLENLVAGLPHAIVAAAALLAVARLRAPRFRTAALAALVCAAPLAALSSAAHLGEARVSATPLRLETTEPAPRLVHPHVLAFEARGGEDRLDALAVAFRTYLYPSANVTARVDVLSEYGGFQPRRFANLVMTFGGGWSRAARRFGATHVVLPPPADGEGASAAASAVEGGALVQREETPEWLELWTVPHRPWAFFANSAIAVARPQDAHQQVHELVARGDDAAVVVEATEAPATAPGRVLSVARETHELRIDAEAAGPALLVVNDAYWPGWRAWVDGKETRILAADLLVRAVAWPPGRHRLVMRYEPMELRVGLWVSALGLVTIALLAVGALRDVRRRAPGRITPGAPPADG